MGPKKGTRFEVLSVSCLLLIPYIYFFKNNKKIYLRYLVIYSPVHKEVPKSMYLPPISDTYFFTYKKKCQRLYQVL